MLVKKDTKILRGGLDVANKGANIVTDLLSKTIGVITRTSVLSELRWRKF